ncbi:MAG: cupin domain-containing protein [Caulobacter sp.]
MTPARAFKLGVASVALALSISAAASAQVAEASPPEPSGFASQADVQAQLSDMLGAMKPDQGFAWRPLVRDGTNVAAIEIWKKPGRPAVHPSEAEYAIVLEGAGTLVSGGALVDPETRRPGLVEGSRIEGGATRPLGAGDVILIPAGVPHWFGIIGERLVLLGIKLPGGS